MSLHYLLDGYNILKQMASLRDLPLEDGRWGLLRWINATRPQGSINNRVTVVFDGHPDQYSQFPGAHTRDSQKSQEIRVIFTDGCSADDQIKLMVEEDVARNNCVVVSDDKGIFLYARSLGARVMSVAAFTSKRQVVHARADQNVKNISLSRQEKINKEFKVLWLKEKP